MGKRFYVVLMCTIKSHFVTIDSAVIHGIMKEISPEFDVSREGFSGENRETFWKNIFDFKRLRVSKQKVLTGMIETDGVVMCIHYRRLKKDRPIPASANHEDEKEADPAKQEAEDNDFVVDVTKHEDEMEAGRATQEVEDNDSVVGATKHEENKEEDPTTQKVRDNDFVVGTAKDEDGKEAGPATQRVHANDFVVGADPGNTNIITIPAPKRAEYGTDGNLCQKDMRLSRFSRARYSRESSIMKARKKIETWNARLKEYLEVLSEVTSRGADFKAFRKFMKVRVAHWDALCEEYTNPDGLFCERTCIAGSSAHSRTFSMS